MAWLMKNHASTKRPTSGETSSENDIVTPERIRVNRIVALCGSCSRPPGCDAPSCELRAGACCSNADQFSKLVEVDIATRDHADYRTFVARFPRHRGRHRQRTRTFGDDAHLIREHAHGFARFIERHDQSLIDDRLH